MTKAFAIKTACQRERPCIDVFPRNNIWEKIDDILVVFEKTKKFRWGELVRAHIRANATMQSSAKETIAASSNIPFFVYTFAIREQLKCSESKRPSSANEKNPSLLKNHRADQPKPRSHQSKVSGGRRTRLVVNQRRPTSILDYDDSPPSSTRQQRPAKQSPADAERRSRLHLADPTLSKKRSSRLGEKEDDRGISGVGTVSRKSAAVRPVVVCMRRFSSSQQTRSPRSARWKALHPDRAADEWPLSETDTPQLNRTGFVQGCMLEPKCRTDLCILHKEHSSWRSKEIKSLSDDS